MIEAVQHFFRAGKPVGALCHGAQLLAAAGVLEGRTCSAYPACRTEVELAHGIYADIAVDAAMTDRQPRHRARLAGPPGIDQPVPRASRNKDRALHMMMVVSPRFNTQGRVITV